MSFKNLKYCWLLDVIWASYVKISPRKKITKDLKKKKNRILRETWSGDCACTEGNPRQAPPVRKINFVLLFCAMRKQHVYTCKRVCEMVLSQRRNRRGSFQATPVRTRRSRLSLSLRLSLFPSATAFLVAPIDPIEPRLRRRPRRRIHFRARCYRGEVRVCRRCDTHRYIWRKKKEDQRSPLLLSRAHEAHRRWTLFCISLDSYRPGASIERPNNEPRTYGFQRAMTQTQFKIEFKRKIARALFPRFGRSVPCGERAILLDSIFEIFSNCEISKTFAHCQINRR